MEIGTVIVSAGKFEQKIEEITVSVEVIKPNLIENKKNVVVNISASVESQIANLEKKEDQQLFLEDLNLKEPALNKVIRSGYDLLNLIKLPLKYILVASCR